MLVGFHCSDRPWEKRDIAQCMSCTSPCLPLPIVAAIWTTEIEPNADDYHSDPNVISVTETIGCPRKAFWKKTTDYTESPPDLMARWTGHVMHKAIEAGGKHCPGGFEVPLLIDLGGGMALRGSVDYVRHNTVTDWKTVDAPRKTYDEDNAVQLSIYAEMLLRTAATFSRGEEMVTQVARKKVAEHSVHRVDGALDEAIKRAREILGVIHGARGVEDLPPSGRFKKFYRAIECDFCPFRLTCEDLDGEREADDD